MCARARARAHARALQLDTILAANCEVDGYIAHRGRYCADVRAPPPCTRAESPCESREMHAWTLKHVVGDGSSYAALAYLERCRNAPAAVARPRLMPSVSRPSPVALLFEILGVEHPRDAGPATVTISEDAAPAPAPEQAQPRQEQA